MSYPAEPRIFCPASEMVDRFALPYGQWTCADGTRVLFNRSYQPIWRHVVNGRCEQALPNEWIAFKQQRWLYGDGYGPWENKTTRRRCLLAMKRFFEGKDIENLLEPEPQPRK